MGKSSSKAPAAPDPYATASAQGAANKETAITQAQLNMVNQETPYGSLTYSERGKTSDGNPQYTAKTTLSPAQQQILDQSNQAQIGFGQTANQQLGAVQERLSQPVDYNQFGAAPTLNEDARQRATQNIIARTQDPRNAQRAALETQLVNQGFQRGTEAFDRQMDEYNRANNDFLLAADQAGTQEMGSQYSLERAARDAQINEMLQQRQVPLNELLSLLSGTQTTSPQFVATPQVGVGGSDLMGGVYGSYNGMVNSANSQNAQNAANTQGLYSLAGAVGGGLASSYGSGGWSFSDRRLKHDIEAVGTLDNGLTVYIFRYVNDAQKYLGLMADEVKKIHPHAVRDFHGYDQVNYAEAVL
jgi:hypothetical protein